jgi:precorrin-2/cobalt-factor-2 C20-methyltransferase
MKVGQHFEKIRGVLSELGLIGQATIIERATRDDEKITALADVPEGERPYFSTILIYKGGESW